MGWFKFWVYFNLPVAGALSLLVAGLGLFLGPGSSIDAVAELMATAVVVVFGAAGILQLAVAHGLHRRRAWAWRLNWVVLIWQCLAGALALDPYDMPFSVLLVLMLTFWMIPNGIYWLKRDYMFSKNGAPPDQPTAFFDESSLPVG